MAIKSDQGVSEIIGVVLLVSMVALLIMVVATALISQPRPEKIPEVNLAFSVNGTKNGSVETAPYKITFTYLGGDELEEGKYFFIINNEPVLINGPTWSANDPIRSITYNKEKPLDIKVYYKGATGQVLLGQTYIA